ncbi:MAG TPA: hypothetical protein VLA64_03365, partial [Azonexus sp.]|nr:hypothetical protein [Azonexus sp.]
MIVSVVVVGSGGYAGELGKNRPQSGMRTATVWLIKKGMERPVLSLEVVHVDDVTDVIRLQNHFL